VLTSKFVWWIPIAALTLALFQLPYAYYVLLRIAVCAACVFLAFSEAEAGRTRWSWCLGIVAVLYNPIFRVHLNRDLWWLINFGTIWLFAIHMWSSRRTKTDNS
jgi:hypothetical protein